MGREYMGIIRTTFVINEKGLIEQVIEKVDTKNTRYRWSTSWKIESVFPFLHVFRIHNTS
jgi:hypothetical protein